MKKILIVLGLLLLASPVFARETVIEVPLREAATGLVITDDLLATGELLTTEGVTVIDNIGFNSLISNLTPSSDVDVTYQLSNDNVNWYNPVDTSQTSLNAVITTATDDFWVVFDARLSKYIRFIFDPDAPTRVENATLIYQRSN